MTRPTIKRAERNRRSFEAAQLPGQRASFGKMINPAPPPRPVVYRGWLLMIGQRLRRTEVTASTEGQCLNKLRLTAKLLKFSGGVLVVLDGTEPESGCPMLGFENGRELRAEVLEK
jgi:hypothetical protein